MGLYVFNEGPSLKPKAYSHKKKKKKSPTLQTKVIKPTRPQGAWKETHCRLILHLWDWLQQVRHHLLLGPCNDNTDKGLFGGIWPSPNSVNIRFQVALLCLVAVWPRCVIGLSNNRPSACLIIHISQYDDSHSANYIISIMRECHSAADTLRGRYSPRKLLKCVCHNEVGRWRRLSAPSLLLRAAWMNGSSPANRKLRDDMWALQRNRKGNKSYFDLSGCLLSPSTSGSKRRKSCHCRPHRLSERASVSWRQQGWCEKRSKGLKVRQCRRRLQW